MRRYTVRNLLLWLAVMGLVLLVLGSVITARPPRPVRGPLYVERSLFPESTPEPAAFVRGLYEASDYSLTITPWPGKAGSLFIEYWNRAQYSATSGYNWGPLQDRVRQADALGLKVGADDPDFRAGRRQGQARRALPALAACRP